ncbi:translation initiation factor IF-2 N-terminal domain-containing protein [Rhodococcus zopfii]|uniref:translation initiation factor IF-2 N-terminal domain-containing protein n=1 Tax=Rhodococcus zopfii TaxID=43772 RepID=UPI0011112683|nr:translation initiation factor IF-2 N-terminal domain-containing protein [Rhodococcus zopfii]
MADQVPPDNNSTEAAAELPAKIRVHALAKLLGLTSKQVIAKAAEFGHELRSAHSTLHRDAAEQIRDALVAPVTATEETAPAAQPEPEPAPEAPAEPEAAQEAPAEPESQVEAAPEPQLAGPGSLFTAPVQDTPLFDVPQPAASAEPVFEAPLFLQPELAPPAESTPRRRRTRRGAETPAEPVAETDETDETLVEGESAEVTDETDEEHPRRRRRGRRGRGRGRGETVEGESTEDTEAGETRAESEPAAEATETPAAESDTTAEAEEESAESEESAAEDEQGEGTSRRRRRRRRRKGSETADTAEDDSVPTVIHEREPRSKTRAVKDEVQGISGSTRLEAKRQRRRDGREAGRRRPPILTESEFLARRESVDRVMVVRERTDGAHAGMTQVAVLEDGILVEHFVTSANSASMVGNVYLGRVQNVLPSMEAAFIDIGRGRNGVLYAGEVNWEAAGLGGNSRKIEQALKPGDQVVVQVSKDPVGHKGARLTTQISLAGRFLVYVPGGSSTGISRKLPDTERKRLKEILREIVPAEAGVIIRTAAEGVSEEELSRDVTRLQTQWAAVEEQAAKAKSESSGQPKTLYEEPDLLVKVVRDLFNEDFSKLVIEGDKSWRTVENYIRTVASDLLPRVEQYSNSGSVDVFGAHRIDEQLAKALDRKVWLPSGGTLVIDRTEAMTVVDVNTGKFTGAGGNLEETVTRNNLEAAEEIVRQMRLRDIGGMIVVDFIDMVLESNRDLVLRRLTEALGRDRTRHQVSEVTSLGLVQMTRKRLGTGLVEAFSTTCEHCHGRGLIVHSDPIESKPAEDSGRSKSEGSGSRRKRSRDRGAGQELQQPPEHQPAAEPEAQHHPTPEEAAARRAHPVALAMAAHHATEEDAGHVAEAVGEHTPEPAVAEESLAADSAPVTDTVTTAEPVAGAGVDAEPAEQVGVAESGRAAHEPETRQQDAQQPEAPRRRRARRVSRAAAAPTGDSESAGTVFVIPTPTVAEAPAAAPAPAAAAGDGDAATAVVERRPRRRRAAGRPAGPPVDAEA